MDYEKMTKEELIRYIKECEKKRAFTFEDQMKLAFIDNSPFTVWASDRDCIIKFWSGECEKLYGYSKEDALGKDFVELFVAEDEKKAAREDQLKIIDDNEIFHNIANDIGKKGNTLRLLTNCWRLKAPGVDEYWNFEMGLIVSFYDQELARLNQIIAESRLLKESVNRFLEYSKQIQNNFKNRRRTLKSNIRECKAIAVKNREKCAFEEKTKSFHTRIHEIEEKFDTLIYEYTEKIKDCDSSLKCDSLLQDFKDKIDDMVGCFDDIVIDFQEISIEYVEKQNNEMVIGQDAVLKDSNILFDQIHDDAFNVRSHIEKEINEYKSSIGTSQQSEIFMNLLKYQEAINSVIKLANDYSIEILNRVQSIKKNLDVVLIRQEMNQKYDEFLKKIEDIKVALEEL